MKILACTDGSQNSLRTMEKTSIIAEGCKADEVLIIHVIEEKLDISDMTMQATPKSKDVKEFRELQKIHEETGKNILSEALKIFEDKNIQARTVLKKGHPADIIRKVASEEGIDMIAIGSRGLSGLQKIFLGSVSNAVLQEVKDCIVMVMK